MAPRSQPPRAGSWDWQNGWAEWMSSDLSKLDLLVIQIDGLHTTWCWSPPSALMEKATRPDRRSNRERRRRDNLIERGFDPKVCRLFIIDGAKALSKVIRRTFGAHTPIQRCQIPKARNVIERCPSRCMRQYAGRSGRLGSSTMPIKPRGCCAISPVRLTRGPRCRR
jgi:hypothetical protein